jgi:hypothetical protein
MLRMQLNEFVAEARARAETVRSRLRASADQVIKHLPLNASKLNGNIFVESVGTTVRFDGGEAEYLYSSKAISMRDVNLDRGRVARTAFFKRLAAQLPPDSRVLNVGAGGDVVPILCMQAAEHEIVSTDIALDVVKVLSSRVDSPVFASNIVHFDEVLPENPDFLIGNSVLGYIDPEQIGSVVDSIVGVMSRGAVFTFDLAPHPHYFAIAMEHTHQMVANESAADPYVLLRYVRKYGSLAGINAMAFQAFSKALAVNLAIVAVLQRAMVAKGLECTTGIGVFDQDSGGRQVFLTLRCSRTYPAVLVSVEGETLYNDPTKVLGEGVGGYPWFGLFFIDRQVGGELAIEFGIHKSRRSDPWRVARYVHENQKPSDLSLSVKADVLRELDPVLFSQRIWPFLHEKKFVAPIKLNPELLMDQILHKFVLSGESEMSSDQADAAIDAMYAKYQQRKNLVRERRIAVDAKSRARETRKRVKAQRRKTRRSK